MLIPTGRSPCKLPDRLGPGAAANGHAAFPAMEYACITTSTLQADQYLMSVHELYPTKSSYCVMTILASNSS